MRTPFLSLLLSVAFLTLASPASAAESGAQNDTSAIVVASTGDTPAGHNEALLVAEPPKSSSWTLDTSITLKSGRPFEDQGFTLTHDPVVELDATACRNGLCFDLWRADTGKVATHETDFQVWKDFKVGSATTIEVKAAYYELYGPDVPEMKFSISHPLTDACMATGSYEQMWHGFEEKVWRVQASCTKKLGDTVTLDVTPRIAHSENFDQWVPAVDVGVSFPLTDHATARIFGIAFGGRTPDAFIGLKVGRTFGN